MRDLSFQFPFPSLCERWSENEIETEKFVKRLAGSTDERMI